MEQKFIFFDVDGTLFNQKGELVESAASAIQVLKKSGHKIFISTGRSRGEITRELRDLSFDGYICSAGSYVEVENQVLFHQPLESENLPELFRYFERHKILYLAETNEKIYATQENYDMQVSIFKNLHLPGIDFFISIMEVCKSMDEIEGINKLLFFQSKIEIKEISEKFGDEYTILPGTIEMLDGTHGEIFGKDIHKARGMEKVLQYYGKDRSITMAFGDGSNDMEMLQMAGIGIAMGHAKKDLKEVADYITDTPVNEGIKKALDHFGLL